MKSTSRNKELAKNTVILGIGQIVPKFLAMVVLPVLTTFLTTEVYGTYDLITSLAGLLIPLLTVQIQQAVFRFLLTKNEIHSKEEYISTAVAFVSFSSLIMLPIVFIVLKVGFDIDNSSGILVCVLFVAEAYYHLFGQTVRGLGFNLKYSISVIIYATVNMVATIVFVALLKWNLNGVLISLSVGYLAADIYMLFASGMINHVSHKDVNTTTLRQLLAFSAPIVPSSISLWIVNLSDRLIIIHFLGKAANGIYAVANKIPTLYNTAYHVFSLAWMETATRVTDDGDPTDYYSDLFRNLYNFLIGVMLILIPVTPLIFLLLVKGEYGVAINQVPILYFGVFFNSFVNFYSGIYIALKRTKQVGVSSAVGAILNATINLTMISKFGLYAASISTALSFMIIALYRAYDLNKIIKIKYRYKEIVLGMILFVLSSVLLYLGETVLLIPGFVIAVVYNVYFNRIILFKIKGMLKAKRNR